MAEKSNRSDKKKCALNAWPVAAEQSGLGLPYAPENWPEEGDVWGWRTGRRVHTNGTFHDRYLYLPTRLNRLERENPNPNPNGDAQSQSQSRRKSVIFASKLAVERYIKAKFPEADVEAFFASFVWKIPALPSAITSGNAMPIAAIPLQQISQAEEDPDSDCGANAMKCKAGNKKCDSLMLEAGNNLFMPCDICCDEHGFCRDCCCIFCCKTVNSAYGGYSYMKCQVNAGDGICGHVAHMECALRARMAGTVGGLIGLDAEYQCRRCDARTDLISHVNNLVQTCKVTDMDYEIQKKILTLAACLLRGSEKPAAKALLSHIELAISKLKCGINLEEIWKVNDGLSDHGNYMLNGTINGSPRDVKTGVDPYDCLPHSLKLEADVDQVLQTLRKSQESEYMLAEETLQEHKTYLQNLYQQLGYEKSELASQNSSGSDVMFSAVRQREEQIRRELVKFEDMKKVANGFGRTSKDVLKEHFGLKIGE